MNVSKRFSYGYVFHSQCLRCGCVLECFVILIHYWINSLSISVSYRRCQQVEYINGEDVRISLVGKMGCVWKVVRVKDEVLVVWIMTDRKNVSI